MKIFEWSQDFITSIEGVDEQHHALVDLFSKLSEAIYAGGNNQESALLHTYEQLQGYVKYHFAHELKLMRQERLDDRSVAFHCLQHDQFSKQLSGLWASRGSMGNPANTFLEFLTSWLALHILGVDQLMSRQIDLIRGGETPERAYEVVTIAESGDRRAKVVLNGANALYLVLAHLNAELVAANARLESRVAQRTIELHQVNKELVRANQKLEILSNSDGLLQIANRRYFDDRLAQECARAFRSKKTLALLMIDVDFFKLYNDTYGHPAGDACLQALAQAISSTMQRASDLVARYGGEEFVVMLPETDTEGALVSAQKICDAVVAMALPHSASVVASHVTVSVGAVSMVPTARECSVPLLGAADGALYAAKQGGRNRAVLA